MALPLPPDTKMAALEAAMHDARRINTIELLVIGILSAGSWALVVWVASCASEALL